MELYRSVIDSYRKISIDAFNFHIKKLILNGILERGRDQGRGSIIYYSLTDKAKQQQRLKILTVKPKKERILFEKELEEERRVKLYFLLFVASVENISRQIQKFEMDQILSNINHSENDLVIKDISKSKFINEDEEAVREAGFKWSDIIFTTYKPINGFEFKMIEHFFHGGNEKMRKNLIQFTCTFPGTSITDMLTGPNRPIFEHIDFSHNEIVESFEILTREKMLIHFTKYDGEWRYKINDNLEPLIRDLHHIKSLIHVIILITCTLIRRPTKKEIRWLELMYGLKKANELRIQLLSTKT